MYPKEAGVKKDKQARIKTYYSLFTTWCLIQKPLIYYYYYYKYNKNFSRIHHTATQSASFGQLRGDNFHHQVFQCPEETISLSLHLPQLLKKTRGTPPREKDGFVHVSVNNSTI